MSTLTADTCCRSAPAPGITASRVAKAEWIKFRSLRSTWYSLGAAMVVAVGLGVLFSVLRGNDVANHGGLEGLRRHGLDAGEPARHVPGSARRRRARRPDDHRRVQHRDDPRLAVRRSGAQPGACRQGGGGRRSPRSSSATIASLLAFTIGQAALSAITSGSRSRHPARCGPSSAAASTWPSSRLLGLGCGFAIRSTGGALATLFGLLLVLPLLAQALPSSLAERRHEVPAAQRRNGHHDHVQPARTC